VLIWADLRGELARGGATLTAMGLLLKIAQDITPPLVRFCISAGARGALGVWFASKWWSKETIACPPTCRGTNASAKDDIILDVALSRNRAKTLRVTAEFVHVNAQNNRD
jgi:hypothetical protein